MFRKPAFWIVVIAVIAALFAWKRHAAKPPAQSLVPYVVSTGTLRVSVQATGNCQPKNRVALKPPISGRVEDILVNEGDYVKKGQILAYLSSQDRAALLDAASAKGPDELARWEDLYKATPLMAPLNGQIIARDVEPGQSVFTTDSVLVMSDHLIVLADVDETDIGKIKLGQDVTLTLDAYPDTEIPSRVTHIAYEAKTVNNVTMYEVETTPKAVPSFMRSGMTANVEFHVARAEGVLCVPEEAVTRDAAGVATVLKPDAGRPGQGVARTVACGLDDGKNFEIKSGLVKGETILVPQGPQISAEGKSQASNPLFHPPAEPTRTPRSGSKPK